MTSPHPSPPNPPETPTQSSSAPGIVSSGWLGATTTTAEAPATRRLGGAFGVSLALHGAFFALALLVFAVAPSDTLAPIFDPITVVYLERPGEGGGGGGSPAPAPPKPIEIPKTPPPRPTPVTPLPPVDVPPPPPPSLSLPVMTTNAAVPQATGPDPASLATLGGGGRGRGAGPGRGDGVGPGEGTGFGGGAAKPGSGITYPRILREEKPTYTAEALRAKIQGEVQLEAVVRADGTIGDVRVIRSLDRALGLDNAAITAARRWLFVPAKDPQGKPVDVIVTLVLEFNLY